MGIIFILYKTGWLVSSQHLSLQILPFQGLKLNISALNSSAVRCRVYASIGCLALNFPFFVAFGRANLVTELVFYGNELKWG